MSPCGGALSSSIDLINGSAAHNKWEGMVGAVDSIGRGGAGYGIRISYAASGNAVSALCVSLYGDDNPYPGGGAVLPALTGNLAPPIIGGMPMSLNAANLILCVPLNSGCNWSGVWTSNNSRGVVTLGGHNVNL